MFRYCPWSSGLMLKEAVAVNLLNIFTDLETNSYHHSLEQAPEKPLPGCHLSRRHKGGNNHFSYLSLAVRQVMPALSYGVSSSTKGRPPPPRSAPPRRCDAHSGTFSTNVPAFGGRDPVFPHKHPTWVGFLYLGILSLLGEGGKDGKGRKGLFKVLCS